MSNQIVTYIVRQKKLSIQLVTHMVRQKMSIQIVTYIVRQKIATCIIIFMIIMTD